jgi:hypothetical protein
LVTGERRSTGFRAHDSPAATPKLGIEQSLDYR